MTFNTRSHCLTTLILTLALTGTVYSQNLSSPVLITEIHYHPDLKQELVEYVELYNPQSKSVALDQWTLDQGLLYEFPANTTLAAHAYLIVAQDRNQVLAKWGPQLKAAQVFGPFIGKLRNEGETITLRDTSGQTVDEVTYQGHFPWPTVGDAVPPHVEGTGHSIQLAQFQADNDSGASWRSEPPTPARENTDALLINLPPQIRQVVHTPLQPQANQPVTITAEIEDSDGLLLVSLSYQKVNPGQYVRLADKAYDSGWAFLTMNDNGTGADLTADDSIFTTEIPASQHAHRTLIRYRITAIDKTSQLVEVPYPDDPQPNFAYFVYNGVPAWHGAIRPGDNGAQGQVIEFPEPVMRSLPAYHLIADKLDVTNCQYNRGYEETRFNGTLVYDGIVYDHIQFRVRGEYSTYQSGKNKWKFFFNTGHDFQARDDFGSRYTVPWKVMNFSACATPWVPANRGMAGVDEALAMALYNLAGLPAPRTHFLQFRVIDELQEAHPFDQYTGDLWGLYLAIEFPDSRFLDEHGLDDGNVYKMEGQGDKKNQGPTQSVSTADLNEFRNGYNRTNTLAWWQENLNLDHYFVFRAINRTINNMDLREGWNVYYYHDPTSDLWTVIPWDLDMLYLPVTHWSGVLSIQNCLNHSSLEIAYQNTGRSLQDLLLTSDQIYQLVDQIAAFIDPVGAEHSMVDMDRAMWDWHPRTAGGHRGAFYENPVRHNDFNGQSIVKTMVSSDHPGMMQWVKDFVLSPPGGGSTYTGNGAPYASGWDFLEGESQNPAIPAMPTITYEGEPGFPVDALEFRASAANHGSGVRQWRIAEVEPNSPIAPAPLSHTLPPSARFNLIETQATWRYFPARNTEPSNPVTAWRNMAFNDTAWAQGRTSIGYGDDDDQTRLTDMRNAYSSVYLRRIFTVDDLTDMDKLILRVYVDDGCIIWINGTEITRLHVSDGPKASDDLTGDTYVGDATWQTIELLISPADVIQTGNNIVAVHLMNASLDSSDLSFDMALFADQAQETPEQEVPTEDLVFLPANTSRALKFEVNAVWESENMPLSTQDILFPASVVTVGHTYRVRSRTKDSMGRSSHWSEPIQFVAAPAVTGHPLAALQVTELMYHPADADTSQGESNVDGDEFEFIEITNTGGTTLDLSEVSFAQGIFFDFATLQSAQIQSGESMILVKNRQAFESRYGTGLSSLIAGQYTGKLSNSGETLTLQDFQNGAIVEFTYSDIWHPETDGLGYSLVPSGSTTPSLSHSQAWKASGALHGTPGRASDPN